ncbi:MAG: hypothetical protein LBU25_02580 [Treponema sp.]|jgi:hypothetical protein|nr:hypothetical protein [Treponema sp.]
MVIMERNTRKREPDYQRVLIEKMKTLQNGRISIIKQDGKIIQINVSALIALPVAGPIGGEGPGS